MESNTLLTQFSFFFMVSNLNRGTNRADATSKHDLTFGFGPVLGGDDGLSDRCRDGTSGDGIVALALAFATATRLAEARTR